MSTRKRILVVEDDTALARVLGDNLRFESYEVECVSDGTVAQKRAREFMPDLVVLDITLPGMNGFDLCAALRQRRQTPILILTARGHKVSISILVRTITGAMAGRVRSRCSHHGAIWTTCDLSQMQ